MELVMEITEGAERLVTIISRVVGPNPRMPDRIDRELVVKWPDGRVETHPAPGYRPGLAGLALAHETMMSLVAARQAVAERLPVPGEAPRAGAPQGEPEGLRKPDWASATRQPTGDEKYPPPPLGSSRPPSGSSGRGEAWE